MKKFEMSFKDEIVDTTAFASSSDYGKAVADVIPADVSFSGPYDGMPSDDASFMFAFPDGENVVLPAGSVKCEDIKVSRAWKWPRLFRWFERLFLKKEYQVQYTFVTAKPKGNQ